MNYFISDAVLDYLIEAVRLCARERWKLLLDYRFDATTGLWRHRNGPVEPPLRLTDVCNDPPSGAMRYPHHDDHAPESALGEYLVQARRLLHAARPPLAPCDPGEAVSTAFEHLRWFELPAECVSAAT